MVENIIKLGVKRITELMRNVPSTLPPFQVDSPLTPEPERAADLCQDLLMPKPELAKLGHAVDLCQDPSMPEPELAKPGHAADLCQDPLMPGSRNTNSAPDNPQPLYQDPLINAEPGYVELGSLGYNLVSKRIPESVPGYAESGYVELGSLGYNLVSIPESAPGYTEPVPGYVDDLVSERPYVHSEPIVSLSVP